MESDDEDDDLPESVDATISRWWRSLGADERARISSQNNIDGDLNPRSRVWCLSRTSDGNKCLERSVEKLRSAVQQGCPDSRQEACHLLALGEHLLWLDGCAQEALQCLQRAKALVEDAIRVKSLVKRIEYAIARCEMQRTAERTRQEALDAVSPPLADILPDFHEVKRVTVSELEKFIHLWHSEGQPLLVTGLAREMVPNFWSFQHIISIAGSQQVDLMKPSGQSVMWAKLEPATCVQVSDFIRQLVPTQSSSLDCSTSRDLTSEKECANGTEPAAKRSKVTPSQPSGLYLFDWSLPLNCPQLAEEVCIPPALANNWLADLPEGTQYHNSWPSLFIGPDGLASGLHVDAFCSSFWMAVFEGTKRWTIFPRGDLPFLYPCYPYSLDSAFSLDVTQWKDSSALLLSDYPALGLTKPWQVCVEPGDVLLVPWGCPHQVENVGHTLAISSNVVNRYNVEESLHWLEVQGLLDPAASDVHHHLQIRHRKDSDAPKVSSP